MEPTEIPVERVTAVLLIDGWHYIQPKSFSVGEYTFGADDRPQRAYFFAKVDQISRELQYFVGPIDCVMSYRYLIPSEVVHDDGSEVDDNAEVF